MDSSVTPASLMRSLLRLAPGFLDSTARASGAFTRERKFPDAMTLLLMVLVYVACDYSFKDTAALGHATRRFPSICTSSLHDRFVQCGDWFALLLSHALTGYEDMACEGARWIRLADASVINGPGSAGTDWRIHVLADQACGRISAVRVEDASVGECASLHPLCADMVYVFDRGYSRARDIHALVAAAGGFIVRIAPHMMLLCDEHKRGINLGLLAKRIPGEGALDVPVLVPLRTRAGKGCGWHLRADVGFAPARLIGTALPGGGAMWLLADTRSATSATEVAAIYRFRWQIELLFKRLKSLTGIGRLKSSKGPSARAWISAKLLLAAMAQRLVRPAGPREYAPDSKGHRHSAMSRMRVAYDAVCQVILGDLALRLSLCETNLLRLINTPRKRMQQPPLGAIRAR